MVLGAHRQPLVAGIEARPLRHRPALQHAVELEPEIPVEPRRVVLLDDEAVALALELAALGLGGLREVALLVIFRCRAGPCAAIALALPPARALSWPAPSSRVLARRRLLAARPSSPPRFFVRRLAALAFSSPRLFFSAAIRSTTFEPLGGGASASGSSMIFSPLAFCFSSISSFSAST